MNKILVATTNQGKFEEIKAGLEKLPLTCLFLPDMKIKTEFEEKGKTYEENAVLKARYFFKKTGILTLADDSGIEVEALKKEMGVRTRRFGAGEKATDEEWLNYFLKRMEAFPKLEQRKARFICVMALFDGKKERIFRGEANGVITLKLQAPIRKGIPLSSCFLPDGFKQVYSALSMAEKARISHRGKALSLVKKFLTGKDAVWLDE